MRKKQILVLFGLVLLSVSLLYGGGTQEKKAEKINLKFQNWLHTEDASRPVTEQLMQMFEEKYPNISVELVDYPYANMLDQLTLACVGGNPPDASMCKTIWVAPLHEGGYVEPLNDYFDQAFFNDFFENNIKGMTYEDGKIMGLPLNPSPIAFFANKELITKAGFNANEKPASWDEMYGIAEKIAKLGVDERGNRIYGQGHWIKASVGAGYFFLQTVWTFGGRFIDDNGKIAFNSPQNIAALEWLYNGVQNEVIPAGAHQNDLRNLFANGALGFYLDGEFGIGIQAAQSPLGEKMSEVYYTMTCPPGVTGRSETFYVEHSLLVPSGAKYKKEGVQLIGFLTSVEAQSHYSATVGGKIPARKSVTNDPKYQQTINTSPHFGTFLEQLKTARPLPAKSSEFVKAMNIVSDSVNAVLNGEDAGEIARETQRQLEVLYKQ